MGSALHRIQVLIIGLILVLAGLSAAVVAVVAPPATSRYDTRPPQPVIASGITQETTTIASQTNVAVVPAVTGASAVAAAASGTLPLPAPAAASKSAGWSASAGAVSMLDQAGRSLRSRLNRGSSAMLVGVVSVLGLAGAALVGKRRPRNRSSLLPAISLPAIKVPVLRLPRRPRLPRPQLRGAARRIHKLSLDLGPAAHVQVPE